MLHNLALALGCRNMIVTGVIIVITILNIIVYNLRQLQDKNFGERLNVPSSLPSGCRLFSLFEIRLATNNFDDALVIGQGGFGKVYKGFIDNRASIVAIKRLNSISKQGAPEFWTEIELLPKLRHSHLVSLVSLIGYCDCSYEKIIVYEYMLHGTIADHLHKIGRNVNPPLSWVQRLKISIGAARGLDYLHTGTGIQRRVIHRDVKSSNILLDENWAAKISDFGISKIGPANQVDTDVTTNVKGSFGYLDPEYFLTHRLTRKSDVYAFGVVLFEVLCGRPAVDLRLPMEQRVLARWAQHCVKEGKIDQIIDPSVKGQISFNSLTEFVQIAKQCLYSCPKERPTMTKVVERLELALTLQERTDSSFIELEIFNNDGAYETQENMDSTTKQHEVVNAGSKSGFHDEQINRIIRQDLEKPRVRRRNRGMLKKNGEDCISENLSLTSPRAASRASVISWRFKSIANSDTLWEQFLPSDYLDIIARSVYPVVYTTEKELYILMQDSPILLDGGQMSFKLDKWSGKKCYMLGARELSIAGKDIPPGYWKWRSLPESRFSEVAELVDVCWFDIRGKMVTRMLSPHTTYAAYLVFKLAENSQGLDYPTKALVRVVGEREDVAEDETSTVYLTSKTFSREFRRQQNGLFPRKRMDGWMEVEMGEFFNYQGDDDNVEMRLTEIEQLNWKSGLIVEGMELRPKPGAKIN